MSSARRHPTRQSIIIDYTLRDLALGRSRDSFADDLAENYLAMVPDGERSLSFHAITADMSMAEFNAARKANRKAVERYIKGQVNLPAELEEAWVKTISPNLRVQCAFALCSRYEFLPVAMEGGGAMDNIARVMTEGAEAFAASSPIVANNQIDDEDRPHAANAYREHMEAASAHLGFALALSQKFPEECKPVVSWTTEGGGNDRGES